MTRFKLAATAAVVVISIAATASAAVPSMLSLGPKVKTKTPSYLGYYDGHKDAYLVTDVSSKAQATAMHINYSAELAKVKGAPPQYFIAGKAAPGQIAVFGSEPGESDYNPLWEELIVTWKPGVNARAAGQGRPDQRPREAGQADREGRARGDQRSDHERRDLATSRSTVWRSQTHGSRYTP